MGDIKLFIPTMFYSLCEVLFRMTAIQSLTADTAPPPTAMLCLSTMVMAVWSAFPLPLLFLQPLCSGGSSSLTALSQYSR